MRIVVKIGSNLIQTEEGDIDLSLISKLGREIKRLKALGNEVIIVSSGAVLCGLRKLNLTGKTKEFGGKASFGGHWAGLSYSSLRPCLFQLQVGARSGAFDLRCVHRQKQV
jgi:hypothetical protein